MQGRAGVARMVQLPGRCQGPDLNVQGLSGVVGRHGGWGEVGGPSPS